MYVHVARRCDDKSEAITGVAFCDRAASSCNAMPTFVELVAIASGEPLQRRKQAQPTPQEAIRFQGQLRDRHTTAEGCEYVRIALVPTNGSSQQSSANVIDAEFIFVSGKYLQQALPTC